MTQLKHSIFDKQLVMVKEQTKMLETEIWNNNKAFLNELSDTLSPCSWTSIRGKSVHEKGQMVRVTSNVNGKKAKRSREMLAVTPLPANYMWIPTPINFMVADAKELSSVPYLGDGDSIDSFTDELISAYGGHLRVVKSNVIIDDNVFVDLVRALISCQRNVLEKTHNNQEVLLQSIFQTILPAMSNNATVDKLQEKYLKLTGMNSKCTENVDGLMTVSLTHERALHSYHKLFCRRCCMYNCQLHSLENRNSQRNFPVRKFRELKPFQEPCSDACFMLMVGGCFNGENNNNEVPVHVSAQNTRWTANDRTMFLALYEVFPKNCCIIAKILITKSCQQVYKYRYECIKSSDIRPVTRPITKRKAIKKLEYKTEDSEKAYVPCDHEGRCNKANVNCSCVRCEKFCNCSVDCSKRVPFCHCDKNCNSKKCFCYSAQRECSETCKCGEACKNKALQQRLSKKLKILTSKVHGWGAYIPEMCQKDELINEYRGEIISVAESERRGKVYDKIKRTYLFNLNDRYVIDAARFGTEIRFANYSKMPNCVAKVMMVNGDHRIGIYANRMIEKG